jgi:hypothetical protein
MFASAILVITIVYWLVLLGFIGKYALSKKTKGDGGRKNIKPVPDSTLSWILQAAREAAMSGGSNYGYGDAAMLLGVPRKEQELRGWSFSITDNVNGVARVVRRRGEAAPLMYENVFVHHEYKR